MDIATGVFEIDIKKKGLMELYEIIVHEMIITKGLKRD